MVNPSMSDLFSISFKDKLVPLPFISIILFYTLGFNVNLILGSLTVIFSVATEAIGEILKRMVLTSRRRAMQLDNYFRAGVGGQRLPRLKRIFSFSDRVFKIFIVSSFAFYVFYFYTIVISLTHQLWWWFGIQIGVLAYSVVMYLAYPIQGKVPKT
jgi:hypothetical protein